MKKKRKLLDIIKEKLEFKKYSQKTQKNYRWWIKKYILFHQKKHPVEMGIEEIESFLNYLSKEKKLSATSQNQALNAIAFLYEEVLEKKIKNQNLQVLRAKREDFVPVTLSKDELKQIFYHINGIYRLMATLMYGCGLRMSELLNLRIKDIDLKTAKIFVERRVLPLPQKVIDELSIHIKEIKKIYEDDLLQGYGYLYSKDKNANLILSYLFPMKKVSLDKKANIMVRFPISDKTFARNIKQASLKAKIEKKVSANTLRHTYALHLLQSGIDIKTLQELLGHKEKSSTMIYQHMLRESNKKSLSSPLDF